MPAAPVAPGPSGENWHRWHYPIGALLSAYGVTVLLTSALGWTARRDEMEGYLGAGMATPALAAIKVVELLLVVITLAGLLRRRDVWFLPALVGWTAGFGVFAVLDVVKGNWSGLLEHVLYLAAFAFLLFLSYGFSVKARVGRSAPPAPVAPEPGQGPGQPPRPSGSLTRTQEFALAALNRWQRAQGQQNSPQGPPPQVPPQGPAQGQPYVPPQGPQQGPPPGR